MQLNAPRMAAFRILRDSSAVQHHVGRVVAMTAQHDQAALTCAVEIMWVLPIRHAVTQRVFFTRILARLKPVPWRARQLVVLPTLLVLRVARHRACRVGGWDALLAQEEHGPAAGTRSTCPMSCVATHLA